MNGPSQEVFNGDAQGMKFFGLAIKQGSFDRLWAADFGAQPQIRQFDKDWKVVPTQGFANPFATGAPVDPADPAKGDDGRLNAPWGVAVAPASFGPMGGKVLVGNFGGAGRIAAFDDATGKFVDYLRDEQGAPAGIDGLWNILFGNGESLGDADTLYFAAGPADEKEALFGALRVAR